MIAIVFQPNLMKLLTVVTQPLRTYNSIVCGKLFLSNSREIRTALIYALRKYRKVFLRGHENIVKIYSIYFGWYRPHISSGIAINKQAFKFDWNRIPTKFDETSYSRYTTIGAGHWKGNANMMPHLSSLLAPKIVITTAWGATRDDSVVPCGTPGCPYDSCFLPSHNALVDFGQGQPFWSWVRAAATAA